MGNDPTWIIAGIAVVAVVVLILWVKSRRSPKPQTKKIHSKVPYPPKPRKLPQEVIGSDVATVSGVIPGQRCVWLKRSNGESIFVDMTLVEQSRLRDLKVGESKVNVSWGKSVLKDGRLDAVKVSAA